MGDVAAELADVLSSFEQDTSAFSEHDVEMSLENLRHTLDKRGEVASEELQAEEMAFGFSEDCSNTNSGWGLYFGPEWVLPQKDGRMGEWPSIHCVTAQMLTYWSTRAREARHPILRARYGGLVWEFGWRVTSQKANPEMARTAIDAVADIAAADCHEYVKSVMTKLERALSLSLLLNDGNRINRMCKTIMSYEEKHGSAGETMVWGLSYDLLLEAKGVSLSDEQAATIIRDLEDKLRRSADANDGASSDPFAVESIALRLAGYYRKTDRKEDVRRVLMTYGKTFLTLAEKCDALVGSAHLWKVHSVYVDFGLRTEAEAIAVRLRETGKRCKDELARFSVPVEIPKQEMERYVESLISDTFETSMLRIAFTYVPKQNEIRQQIQDLSEKNPILFDAPMVIQDDEGRPVASVGSMMDDMDGRVVLQMSQNMQLAAIHLKPVLQGLREKYKVTAEEVVNYIYGSPVFAEDRKAIIELGINAYLANEFVIALHILIPQIENAVRRLVELTGGAIYRKHRTGSLVLKTFDEVLRDDRIVKVLGDDTALYLRVLFTDERGWNTRNRVCHGMMPSDEFGTAAADRVFHALMVLCHVRSKGSKEESHSEE